MVKLQLIKNEVIRGTLNASGLDYLAVSPKYANIPSRGDKDLDFVVEHYGYGEKWLK